MTLRQAANFERESLDHMSALISRTVGNVAFSTLTFGDAVETVVNAATLHLPLHVHLLNAYSVVLAADSSEYRAVISGPSCLNLPDGRPIGWFSRMAGHRPRVKHVRGNDFFNSVLEESQHTALNHYLLGSTPSVLVALRQQLNQRYPDARIVGTESPPFRPATPGELVLRDEKIQKVGAHIVWVGLGTPKQDLEAARLVESTGVVAVAVGAAFDFSAGTLNQAPLVMRRLGFEWLFRLLQEPRRLWRRYVFGNVKFLVVAARGIVTGSATRN